eukprot:gb/GEZN01005755.1/.p1 GENE.gb/GEZN01005755.1/~~gb/GEZN01005755.1/.p1  ORF type:complete len:517 (-),score=60.03 gb/GEZN01005755.1/:131-1681(-)
MCDYTALADDVSPPSSLLQAFSAVAGTAGMLLGVISMATTKSSLFFSRDVDEGGDSAFVPRQGVTRVMARPRLPSDMSGGMFLSDLVGPSALFLYQGIVPAALMNDGTAQAGWVYGAKLRPKDLTGKKDSSLVAFATGHSADVVRGQLLRWPKQFSFRDKLRAADELHSSLRREVVSVVLKDGSVVKAFWYVQALGQKEKTGVRCSAKKVVDALRPLALRGRIIFITGTCVGLGAETTRQLLRTGATVVVGNRNSKQQDEWIAKTRIELNLDKDRLSGIVLDLSDLASVHACAEAFLKSHRNLDILILNAGIMMTPLEYTTQGYEKQFGVNVLGHFLLTKLLIPALKHQRPSDQSSRVIFLSSLAHAAWGAQRFQKQWFEQAGHVPEGVYDKQVFYQQSKLGGILLAQAFSNMYDFVDAVAVHPGIIPTTALSRSMSIPEKFKLTWDSRAVMFKESLKSIDRGAATTVFVATSSTVERGGYYQDCAPYPPHPAATSYPEDAEELFALCDKLSTDYQ